MAAELKRAGHEAEVPDLRDAIVAGAAEAVLAAAQMARGADVAVGHSGAGRYLPSTTSLGTEQPNRLVFVDAAIPPCEGVAAVEETFITFLRSIATDGVLPKWSKWWGDGTLDALVSDPHRRAELEEELPEVPLRAVEEPLPVPKDWCSTPVALLVTSESYRTEIDQARRHGWPFAEQSGGHLAVVNDPVAVAEQIARLALL